MELEVWHLVVLASAWLIGQPIHRWLRLREKELEQAHTLRRHIVESPDPEQSVSALARLEAFEATMKQTQQAQEQAIASSSTAEPETIEIDGKKFHPVLSFEDFAS